MVEGFSFFLLCFVGYGRSRMGFEGCGSFACALKVFLGEFALLFAFICRLRCFCLWLGNCCNCDLPVPCFI